MEAIMATAAETAATPIRRAAAGNHPHTEEHLEDQVAKLQGDIKAIAASLAKLTDERVSDVRSSAKSQYKSLVKSGRSVVDDLSDQVNAYEGQMVDAIREKPLTAMAGAIGVGFLIALLSRR
jgi:ElaB/YqjD/DUF883 family membrane-anchored ribosome-binding protein